MFAIRATYHTTLQATPMQLVFGRDALLNTVFEANWKYIKDNKQKIINANNKRENARRIQHEYKAGDTVLQKNRTDTKFGETEYSGPYTIANVYSNGMVLIKKGIVTEWVNIRLLKPYFD
jgi:hypothetical protein